MQANKWRCITSGYPYGVNHLYSITSIPSANRHEFKCEPSGISAYEVDFTIKKGGRGLSCYDDIYCLSMSVRALSNQTMTYGEK